jgi:ABC-2 type transport system permease protein
MTIVRELGLLWRRKLLETLRHRLAGGPGFPRGAVLDVFVPGVLCLVAFGAGMGAGGVVIFELDTAAGVVPSAAAHPRAT